MITPDGHARLTELFGRAIELTPSERAGLVARVRADDPELAAELSALLDADAGGGDDMRTGGLAPTALEAQPAPDRHGTLPARPSARTAAVMPTMLAAAADAATIAAPPPLAVGTSSDLPIDGTGETVVSGSEPATVPPMRGRPRPRPAIEGFRILDVLGEGGMGTVYAGEQDAPRRPVAIKVLHATSSAALTRFWAEAEIMARLDHSGIAKVLEAGEADGHPYFVMERVLGVTLDAHVRAEKLTIRARLELFAQLCDAIHHAHVKGVIHRDLKPSNVMVRGDGRIAVLDFGIARVALAGGSSGGETRAGELIGTPVYMSPEQARLRPDEVDARSDVYTLGVMLYELLSGELPYEVRGKALPDVAWSICSDSPRPLGRRDPALRGDLEAICDKALAKEPEGRYQSSAALGDDVRRHLEGAAISARVPGLSEQLRRFARRRPGVAAAIGGAIVAGSAFAAVVTVLWLDAREARRAAEAQRARVSMARDELEARNNQLVLDRARSAISRDPTLAVSWLETVTPRGVDPAVAWAIADEALGRGVAAAIYRGHDDEVRWVEGLPDGFVTGGYDGRALLWRDGATTPRQLWKIGGRIHIARPSPDGALIAIGGDDGKLRVVDADGNVVLEPPGLSGDVEKAAWSPDGRWLVTGDDKGAVFVWPRTGGEGRKLDGPRAGIECIEFTHDGGGVVAGDNDGNLFRWDVASGAMATVALSGGQVVAVWGDGAETAAVGAGGELRHWTLGDGALAPGSVRTTGVPAKTAVFAPDGGYAVIAGNDGRVVEVAVDHFEIIGEHSEQVRAVTVSADGRRIATASDDGQVQTWDLATGRHLTLRGHAQRIRELAFVRRDAQLLSADSSGAVRRWDLDGVPATVLDGHRAPVVRMAVSPDGAYLASSDGNGEIRVWTLASGGNQRLGVHPNHVVDVAFTADRRVVSVASDGTVAWWGTSPGPIRTVSGPVHAVAASSDGRWVAAAIGTGPIAIFDGRGEPGPVLSGHVGGTEAIAFSPDGALLVSGGQDRVVRVWRTAAFGAPPIELGPVEDDTRHIVFSPTGDRVVAAGDEGKLRAWNVRGDAVDPGSLRVLAEHQGTVGQLDLDTADDSLFAVWRDRTAMRVDLHDPPKPNLAVDPGAVDEQRVILPDGSGVVLARPGSNTILQLRHHKDGLAALLGQLSERAAKAPLQ